MLDLFNQKQIIHCLHVRKAKSFTALLIYVDDILITGNDPNAIIALKKFLHNQFRIKDLGDLKYFLVMEVVGIEIVLCKFLIAALSFLWLV